MIITEFERKSTFKIIHLGGHLLKIDFKKNYFSSSLLNNFFWKLILEIIPQKWTIYEGFKDWIYYLSYRSKMISKKILHNTTLSVQLLYNADLSI